MALSQNTYVYMETMETCANQIPKPDEHGSSQRPGMESGKQQTRLLVYNTYSCHEHGNDKRKTDKQWLLRFSHSLSVCARQLLKALYTRTVRTVL